MSGEDFWEGYSQAEITQLLQAWGGGDAVALERLAPVVYEELRAIARRYMLRESPENSLQATALVHEAYLKLVDATVVQWQDRAHWAHFFAIAARLMRRILVDAARARAAGKRGGGAAWVEIHESLDGTPLENDQMVRLRAAEGLGVAVRGVGPGGRHEVDLFPRGVQGKGGSDQFLAQAIMQDWPMRRCSLEAVSRSCRSS